MAAEPVAQLELAKAIRQELRSRAGEAFQSTAQDILQSRLPGFQSITPHGRDGDGGNDGYSRSQGIYTQIYGPKSPRVTGRQAARKAVRDFAKLKRQWDRIRKIKEFWLVTNLDDSDLHIEGALSDIEKKHGVKTRFLGAKELAAEVQKLTPERIESLMGFAVRAKTSTKRPIESLALLASTTSTQLAGLHLLASLHHPVPANICEALLPKATRWRTLWPWLLRRGLAKKSNGLFELDKAVVALCLKNEVEQRKACELWVKPLQRYGSIDCLFLAVLPLLKLGRHRDAIRVVIRAGLRFGNTEWDGLFLQLVDLLASTRMAALLTDSDRKLLRLARATLLLRTGQLRQAIAVFDASLRTTRTWPPGVSRGEILISCGVALHFNDDEHLAQGRYEEAIKWSRAHRDDWVLGRAATNLAQLLDSTDPDRADALIDVAQAAKFRCGDAEGLIAIEMAKGKLEASRHRPAFACGHFRHAQMLAKKLRRDDVQSDILFNLGKSSGELGQWRKAKDHYRSSLAEATKQSQPFKEARARAGLAEALFFLRNWKAAGYECDRLSQLPDKKDWCSLRLTGMHGNIILQLRMRGVADATDVAKALVFARRFDDQDWIGRLLLDSRFGRRVPPTVTDLLALLDSGSSEARANRHLAAAQTYCGVWQWCINHNEISSTVSKRAEFLLVQLLKRRATPTRVAIEYSKQQYGIFMQLGIPWKAIDALQICAERAHRGGFWDDYVAALDQQAVTLGDLERQDLAEPLHLKALKIAERHKLRVRQCISASNLAECLRRLGRLKAALRASNKALAFCDKARDPASYVAILHIQYLIQYASSDKLAPRTLQLCERVARSQGLTSEIVRTLMARGNSASDRGESNRARRWFQQALDLSDRSGLESTAADCRYNLALILREAGQHRLALQTLQRIGDMRHGTIDDIHKISLEGLLLEDCGELRAALAVWREAAQIAANLRIPRHQSYCEARATFLGVLAKGANKLPVTVVDQAEQKLQAAYGTQVSSQDFQQRFDEAKSFFERHNLAVFQVHAYSTIARRLATREQLGNLKTATQASMLSLLAAFLDSSCVSFAVETHVDWLLDLGLRRMKLQQLRAATAEWLATLLVSSENKILTGALLAGFDAAIDAMPRTCRSGGLMRLWALPQVSANGCSSPLRKISASSRQHAIG